MSNTGFTTQAIDHSSKPEGVVHHLDYLTLTVFPAGADDPSAVDLLAEDLAVMFSRHWARVCDMDCEWADKGPAGKIWRRLLLGPAGVALKVPKGDESKWLQIEMKGEAFTWLTSEDVAAVIADLKLMQEAGIVSRWHATRLDHAFDHVPFGPLFMHEASQGGAVRSKVHPLPKNIFDDGLGHHTCYVGLKGQPRVLRLYDLRGYNRLELELKHEHAREAFAELQDTPPDQWGRLGLARLRGFCDFVDPDSASRVENCKLLPWWDDLVGDVAAARLKPRQRVDKSATPAGKMNMKLARCRRDFHLLREALGEDGLIRVVNHLADEYKLRTADDPGQKAVDASDAANLKLWRHFIDGHTHPRDVNVQSIPTDPDDVLQPDDSPVERARPRRPDDDLPF